jgi:MFS transporter
MSTTEARSGVDRTLMSIASVVVVGSIMTTLDTTVVNVAIDRLSQDFDTSLSTIQWIATGYMLALATVIPLTGWAADRFGTKRLYMLSLALFLVGSALSGSAWSAGSLIAFRVLQGFGGGLIMPVGMTILMHAAGRERAGRVMGRARRAVDARPDPGGRRSAAGSSTTSPGAGSSSSTCRSARSRSWARCASCPATSPSPTTASTGSGCCCSPRAWPRSSTGSRRPPRMTASGPPR